MSLVIEGGFAKWLDSIQDDQLRRADYAEFAFAMRYAFVIAPPSEKEAMIEVIGEKKEISERRLVPLTKP